MAQTALQLEIEPSSSSMSKKGMHRTCNRYSSSNRRARRCSTALHRQAGTHLFAPLVISKLSRRTGPRPMKQASTRSISRHTLRICSSKKLDYALKNQMRVAAATRSRIVTSLSAVFTASGITRTLMAYRSLKFRPILRIMITLRFLGL